MVNMRMKHYDRLVRSKYIAVEGPRIGVPAGRSRVRAYLPFLILMLGLRHRPRPGLTSSRAVRARITMSSEAS